MEKASGNGICMFNLLHAGTVEINHKEWTLRIGIKRSFYGKKARKIIRKRVENRLGSCRSNEGEKQSRRRDIPVFQYELKHNILVAIFSSNIENNNNQINIHEH